MHANAEPCCSGGSARSKSSQVENPSGGSEGYDHKKMGITARGAWESVRFHFQTRGVDVDSDDYLTAVLAQATVWANSE